VGPPVSHSTAGSASALVVFSAYDQGAHFNDLPYRRVHSDYRILTTDGKLLQNVHNDNGRSAGGPKEVLLPAGQYQVVARANGYGAVTVPVGDTRGGARRHRIKRILCGSRTVKLSAGELTRGAPVRLRLRRPFANTPKSSEYSEGEIKFR
jgi:hypothetical protein